MQVARWFFRGIRRRSKQSSTMEISEGGGVDEWIFHPAIIEPPPSNDSDNESDDDHADETADVVEEQFKRLRLLLPLAHPDEIRDLIRVWSNDPSLYLCFVPSYFRASRQRIQSDIRASFEQVFEGEHMDDDDVANLLTQMSIYHHSLELKAERSCGVRAPPTVSRWMVVASSKTIFGMV